MALLIPNFPCRRLALATVAWLAAGWGVSLNAAPAGPVSEYHVKAVFVLNFAQFVEWPAAALSAADQPFVIGVVGDDPFGEALDEVVRGEKVRGHPVRIRRGRSVREIGDCHLLFVSSSEEKRLAQTLDAVKERPVLTVGESNGFAESGGMLMFVTEGGRVRLRINLVAAQHAGLIISSKLLRVADVLEAPRPEPGSSLPLWRPREAIALLERSSPFAARG